MVWAFNELYRTVGGGTVINVSAAFHESFKSDLRNVKVRITKGITVYTEKDITNLVYEGLSLVGSSFSIGSVPSNSVKIIFSDVIPTFKELDELKVEIGIQAGASIEWCPLGIFYLSERADVDHNEQRTTIECLDKMVFMEGLYESKLAYPAMIKDVALEIANLAGVEVNPTSFSRLRTQTISKIVGLTHRQAIGIIAQFESGYATFDRLGKLDIRQLNNTTYVISPDEYFSKGLKKNDLKYALGGISVKVNDDTTLSVGQSKGAQIELENSVMTQTILDSIYESLKLTNYYPFTLDWRGNPAVEVGDWVEMTDTKGNSFKGPILNYKLTYDGGLKAEISADTEVQTSTTTAYRPPFSQKLEQIGASIKNAQGNINYYGLTEPPYPKEGDLWFKPNGPEEELWQYVSVDGVLQWKLIISTADIAKIEKEITAIIAKAEKDKQEAIDMMNAAIAEADRLVKEQSTKFEADLTAQKTQIETDITTSRDEAVATAQAGITALETAQNTRMDGIKVEAEEIKATADKTRAEVDLAVVNAGFANLDDTVFALGTLAASARDEAIKKVDRSEYLAKMQSVTTDLGKKAETALVNQQLAEKVAQVTYDKKVGELGTAISGNTTTIQRTETELTSKASQTEVDTVKGRLTTAETGITQNAKQVALKSNQTDLDKATGRLTTAEASIVAQAKEIDLKVAQTDFNNLSGEVSTAKTNINLNKDALLLKAEKSEVNAVSQKVSANEASIKVANDRIDLSATKVEVGEAMEEVVAEDKDKVSGTEIYTDKADDAIVHVEIDGKSYQNAGSGKNLFNFREWINSMGVNKVTRGSLVSATNSSITFKSNLSDCYTESYGSRNPIISVMNNIDYTLSFKKEYGTKGICYVFFYREEQKVNHDSFISYNSVINERDYFTFKIPEGIVGIKVRFGIFDVGETETYSDVQLEEGSVANPYEPPAPTPDYPIEIESLNNFDVISSVGRENLFKYLNIENNYANGIFNKNEISSIENAIDTKETFYTLWTRKEAFVKALGKGIDEDFKHIPCLEGNQTVEYDLVKSDQDWEVLSFKLTNKYVGSVAFESNSTIPKNLLLHSIPNTMKELEEMAQKIKG